MTFLLVLLAFVAGWVARYALLRWAERHPVPSRWLYWLRVRWPFLFNLSLLLILAGPPLLLVLTGCLDGLRDALMDEGPVRPDTVVVVDTVYIPQPCHWDCDQR